MKRLRTAGSCALALIAITAAVSGGAIRSEPIADVHEPSQRPELVIVERTRTKAVKRGISSLSGIPCIETPSELPYTDRELEMLAKMVWGEARGCSPDEQRLVVWTAFQQADAGGDFSGYDTIESLLTKPLNFVAYKADNPILPELYELVEEEAEKWAQGAEPPTLEPYAPTAPYLFFNGDGEHNWFRAEW